MPKDFIKKKQKVGKKKLAPTNATATHFKAKSVALTEQSLAADKKGPTTVRNLTAGELLAQLNHYSELVRSDALRGLSELIGSHSELLLPHAAQIVERSASLTEDSSRKVRLPAHGLLRAVLPLLREAGTLAAHERALTLRLQTLLSHPDTAVRVDGLPLVHLMLQNCPASLVPPPKQVFGCLADLLSGSDQPTSRSRPIAVFEGRTATISAIRSLLRAQTKVTASSTESAGRQAERSPQPDGTHAFTHWRGGAAALRSYSSGVAEGGAEQFQSNPDAILMQLSGLSTLLMRCWLEVQRPHRPTWSPQAT